MHRYAVSSLMDMAYWLSEQLHGDKDFKVGDKVLLYNSRLKMYPGKLKSKWSGPNIVKTVYPIGAIEITDKDGFSFKVNGQRLKKYYGGNIDKEDDETVYTAYPNPMDTAYRLSGRHPVFIFSTLFEAYGVVEEVTFGTHDDGIHFALIRFARVQDAMAAQVLDGKFVLPEQLSYVVVRLEADDRLEVKSSSCIALTFEEYLILNFKESYGVHSYRMSKSIQVPNPKYILSRERDSLKDFAEISGTMLIVSGLDPCGRVSQQPKKVYETIAGKSVSKSLKRSESSQCTLPYVAVS
ncbi:reverse transcriptase domain-containing protein [Tanacetum coccineum]